MVDSEGDAPQKYFQFLKDIHSVSTKDVKNPHCCSICRCGYKYEYSLKRHVLKSHINRAYISPSDLEVFSITVDGHHQRSQTPNLIYSCNACPQLFDGHVELRAHIKSQHQVSVECLSPNNTDGHKSTVIITCPECKAEFYNMRSLNCHMRYHKRASWNPNKQGSPTRKKIAQSSSAGDDSTIAQTGIKLPPKSQDKRTDSVTPVKKRPTEPGPQSTPQAKTEFHEPAAVYTSPAEPSGTCSDDIPDRESHSEEQGRQLRQRTALQNPSMFVCTICQRQFHSYGNMMRHRRMTHESVIKKRPEIVAAKRKHTRQRSKFCDPKIARRFYNKVAHNIAYNMKNCMHGNIRHIESSRYYIQSDSQTDLSTIKSPILTKKMSQLCNIKTKPATSLLDTQSPKQSGSNTSIASQEHIQMKKQFTIDSNSPDVYDKPGLWKFLCLVCMEYFPNTLELFMHQDTIHKRVTAEYLEVGRDYALPLSAIATSNPIGCLEPTAKHQVVCTPSKYTCTKCQSHHDSSVELHKHLVLCGKDLMKPISIEIPSSADPFTSDSYKRRKSSKVKKSRSWNRREDDPIQMKITDMNGFNVRKKKRRSRLESEVEEQMRLEAKLKEMEALSPNSKSPSKTARVTLTDISVPGSGTTPTYSCHYCGISFKYKKVLQRHLDTNCEMMKRITSPGADSTNQTLSLDDPPSNQPITQEADSEVDRLSDPEASNKLSLNSSSTHDISDDLLNPQKSLAQARVLAKFFHPARTCGPCFTCKKPNMARRYSHLQQRSENFVKFVRTKHKNISLQSCICKACEIKFKSEYEKRKSRLAKHAGNRKSPFKTRSLATKKNSTLPNKGQAKASAAGAKKRQKKITKIRTYKSDSKASCDIKPAVAASRKAKRQRTATHSRAKSAVSDKLTAEINMSSLKRKSYTPMSARQTKSIEQIFPDDIDETSSSAAAEVESNAGDASALSPSRRKPDTFIPETGDIIEPEMDGRLSGAGRSRMSADSRRLHGGLISDFHLSADGNSRHITQAESDARLKVIMKFVKDSPKGHRFSDGKASITDIIDAVTERVKENPSLANTLTSAINAAVNSAMTSTTATLHPDSRSIRYTTRPALRNGAVQSISLPCVLDGLVSKTVTSTNDLTEEIKIRRIVSAPQPKPHPHNNACLDVEPTKSNNTIPLIIEQTMIRPKLLNTSPSRKVIGPNKHTQKPASHAGRNSYANNSARRAPRKHDKKKVDSRPVTAPQFVQGYPEPGDQKIGQPRVSHYMPGLRAAFHHSTAPHPSQISHSPTVPHKSTSVPHVQVSPQNQTKHQILHNSPDHPDEATLGMGFVPAYKPGVTETNGMTGNQLDSSTTSEEDNKHCGRRSAESGEAESVTAKSDLSVLQRVIDEQTVVKEQQIPKDPLTTNLSHHSKPAVCAGMKRKLDVKEEEKTAPKPRRKFVMTESSYRHMVEIIDGVASGAIDISTYRYDNLVPDLSDSVHEETGTVPSPNYDFMSQAPRLDCVRVCDNNGCVGPKSEEYEANSCSDGKQPMKNQRLADIISKLSGQREDSAGGTPPQPTSSTSPTGSQNPGSTDSGFVSLNG